MYGSGADAERADSSAMASSPSRPQACRLLRGQDPQGRQARRLPSAATKRSSRQPENRRGLTQDPSGMLVRADRVIRIGRRPFVVGRAPARYECMVAAMCRGTPTTTLREQKSSAACMTPKRCSSELPPWSRRIRFSRVRHHPPSAAMPSRSGSDFMSPGKIVALERNLIDPPGKRPAVDRRRPDLRRDHRRVRQASEGTTLLTFNTSIHALCGTGLDLSCPASDEPERREWSSDGRPRVPSGPWQCWRRRSPPRRARAEVPRIGWLGVPPAAGNADFLAGSAKG